MDRLLGLAPVGVVVVCLADRRIVWTNAAVAGFDSLLERDVSELVAESSRAVLEEVLAAAVAGHDAVRARVIGRREGGQPQSFDLVSVFPEGGPSRQCLLYVRPSLAEDERIMAIVLDHTRTYAVITDRSGAVLWATPAALRLVGVELSDAVGEKLWELTQTNPQVVHRLFSLALESPADVVNERLVLRLDNHAVPFDTYVEHLAGASTEGLLWWGHPVAEQPAFSPDDARVAVLSSAMEAIAREVEWSGFGSSSSVGPAIQRLPGADRLNERERTIVSLLARGLRARAIADRMFLSPSTVRNYLSTIYRKVGVPNQAALIERLFEGHDHPRS